MHRELIESVTELAVEKKFTVGNDLVFIPDFEKSFSPLFKTKVYTSLEIAYCDSFDNSLLRYASTWAAKEAAYKAIKQLHSGSLSWKKIEISREKIAGQPRVNLLGNQQHFHISLSISHDGDYVWAVAIAEKT